MLSVVVTFAEHLVDTSPQLELLALCMGHHAAPTHQGGAHGSVKVAVMGSLWVLVRMANSTLPTDCHFFSVLRGYWYPCSKLYVSLCSLVCF